jgi:hypothetical protein
MLWLNEAREGTCLLCKEKGTNTIDGFSFCDGCYEKVNGNILVICSNEQCYANYGIIERKEENIIKICFINSMSLGISDTMVANSMFLLAQNSDMTIYPVKFCPVCW